METDAVLRLVQEASATYVDPRFRALAAGEVSEKRPGDLVTIADREAEVAITQGLLAAYPDALVLGEEAYSLDSSLMHRFLTAEHAFTVDPVDGTKNFVGGSPDHAVMVAEVRAGVTTRAWIWQPQHERAYVAELGAGTWCNGERVRQTRAADPWRGATSRRAWLERSLPALPPLTLTWISCGIDYPHLIEGDADYLLYARTLPWDHAPGGLLLTEAGGALLDFSGQPWTPRSPTPGIVAAADAAVADTVVERLAEVGWHGLPPAP